MEKKGGVRGGRDWLASFVSPGNLNSTEASQPLSPKAGQPRRNWVKRVSW